MAEILLDVGGFQSVSDFETGEPIEHEPSALMQKVMQITPHLPFPGDRDIRSIAWTVDMALEVNKLYSPHFMLLSFATPMMLRINNALSKEDNAEIDKKLFAEIKRFFDNSDYEAVIVGGGNVRPTLGELDFSGLSKLPTHSMCCFDYAGLFNAADQDAEAVYHISHAKKVVSRQKYIAANPDLSEKHISMLPDFLIMHENGYAFNSITKRGFPVQVVADVAEKLPVYTTLDEVPQHTLQVRGIIDRALDAGKKVALLVLEATGEQNFLLPYTMMDNTDDFFTYDQGMPLYFALASGKKYSKQPYPAVVSTQVYLNTNERYPYSQYFSELPEDTLGRRKDKLTAAVGTRSGFVHESFMADLCIECHSRNLSVSGIFALVNDKG